MDATAIQFEKYWRNKISEEIIQYDLDTHQCYGHYCQRCDISSALKAVSRQVLQGDYSA